MAIGVISSPSAWYNGTIATPDWFKTVQDNSNYAYRALQGLYSAKSFYLDGTGNQSVSTGESQLVIKAPSAGEITPRIVTRDSDNNVRWCVDHNGLPSGYITEFQENWFSKLSSLNNPSSPGTQFGTTSFWAIGSGSGCTVSEGSLSGYPGRLCKLTTNSTNANGIYVSTYQMFMPTANTVHIMEWDAAFDSSTSNCTVNMGLTNTNGGAAFIGDRTFATSAAYFSKSNADTYWQCNATDGTPESSDTGADAPVNGTMQRFRIEYHGASTPFGAATVQFYVNEHLRGSLTTHPPVAGTPLCLIFDIINSANSAHAIQIGPVRLSYTRYLAPTSF